MRPGYRYAWERLPDAVGAEYVAGATMEQVCLRHKTTAAQLRRKLVALGVEVRKAGPRDGCANPRRKLSAEDVAVALEADLDDISHADIGRHFGVSRERIRQICALAGHRPRRERMDKAETMREVRLARAQVREERLMALADAWRSGATLDEIATISGTTSDRKYSVIAYLRRKRPDLFPYRSPNHWKVKSETERRARMMKTSRMWLRGATARQIAEAVGYKNPESAMTGVQQYRQRHPELFPFRRRRRSLPVASRSAARRALAEQPIQSRNGWWQGSALEASV